MDAAGDSAQHQNVCDRLQARGFGLDAFESVKFILSTASSSRLRFAEVYGPKRTLKQAWRAYNNLKRSTNASWIVEKTVREQLQRQIDDAGYLIASALWDANRTSVGDWQLQWLPVPTGFARGLPWHLRPGIRAMARHAQSGKVREAFIPASRLSPAEHLPETLERAYCELGIWDDLYWGIPAKKLRSEREPHAWPVYMQIVIPRLYELLRPYYSGKPHYSDKRDRDQPRSTALYPESLLVDLRDLLRAASPHNFESVTTDQIKAVVQRTLERHTEVPKRENAAKPSK